MAFPFSLLLLFTLTTLSYTNGCVDRERLALLDFKKSFASSPQNNGKLSSWNSSEVARNCCVWEGITCDYLTGHVVYLHLSHRTLESYQLRPSLLQLQYLRSLDLRYNNLSMRIPNFIGSFSELTSLQLEGAGFLGTIPPQLGNLSILQTLDLSWNKYLSTTDNIQWLSHLSSLQSLDMNGFNLSEVKDWISVIRKLPILSDFSCVSCYFPTQDFSSTAIGHHVNSSSFLKTLDLSSSHLSALSLSSLLVNRTTNLSYLKLDYLELDSPFPDIFHDNMMSLENLFLSLNHLEDGIFNSIGNLCNLSELYVVESTINQSGTNILQALSGCASSSLKGLTLNFMNLTGTIPSMLNFKSLEFLDLSYNGMENFPQQNEPFCPTSLYYLDLSNNNLNGVLTTVHFTNLSNLETLDVSNNHNLTVSFDQTLASAHTVYLRSCNLGPSFPTWLLTKHIILDLDISNSKISGTIPIMFWMNLPPHVYLLNLSSNSFSGTLPNMPFYIIGSGCSVDLSSNFFSGLIPFFFFNTFQLLLSKNNFSGFAPIPHSYNFSHISYDQNIIDISDNLLSGSIPYWLGFQMPKLGALILTNNNLSGTIPASIGQTSNLFVFSLRNNRFVGSLPSFLKNCSQLNILDLSGNRFSGFIPSWIGENLINLRVLSLTSNNLMSILPTSLCQLHSLKILDLSHNLLSGNIPSCIQKFTSMAHHNATSSPIGINSFFENYNVSGGVTVSAVRYFNAYITWKSGVSKFQTNLNLIKLIDLSSNNFSGTIPTGLASLVDLDSLDLSCNSLQGSIPRQIGQIKALQVLNLSHNKLYGQIPSSLSQISFLEILDLSHNNLSGRIPIGTQLQSFNPCDFAGNPELCGLPLGKCPGDNDDSVQALQPS